MLRPLKVATDGFQAGLRTPRHLRGTSKGTQDTLRLRGSQQEPLRRIPRFISQYEFVVLWGQVLSQTAGDARVQIVLLGCHLDVRSSETVRAKR